MCNKLFLGRVDAVNKPLVFVVGYQLRVDNVLPETSFGSNSRVRWSESHAEALTNSVSLCMWPVNAGRYFSGYNLLLKNFNFQYFKNFNFQ